MKNMTDFISIAMGLIKILRGFPYGRYLITVFPVFAILIYDGLIISPWSIILVFPFVFAIAAGFTYNTICDANKDPQEKNIITSGKFRKFDAFVILLLFIAISLLSFLIVYQTKIAFLLFIVYMIFWMTYSGAYIRFKESIFAPIIASIVLWAGAPFILLAEFQYLNGDMLLLVLGLFFVYVGHEIKHTTIEYDLDLSYNCKTFAVRVGKKSATIFEYSTLIIGYLFLLVWAHTLICNQILDMIFIIIFLISLISTIGYGHKIAYDFSKDIIFITLPYTVTILFIIICSCIILKLSLLITLFVAWIFLINKN